MTFTAKAWKVVLISVNAKDGGEQGAIIMKTLLLDVMCRSYKAIRFYYSMSLFKIDFLSHLKSKARCSTDGFVGWLY